MKEFSSSPSSEHTGFGDLSRRPASSGEARGDRFEREADWAADAVAAGRAPAFVFSQLPVNGSLHADEAESDSEKLDFEQAPEAEATLNESPLAETGIVMRKAAHDGEVATEPRGVRDTVQLQGQPLDAFTRKSMESRFGFDFGKVRIHTGGTATESARALDAHAYTIGEDIVFGSNEYAPHTTRGQHLLSHELAHTVQQHAAAQPFLQRAEFGTYVSKKGAQNYLDAGAQYYTDWGFPNVKRVSTVKEVLDDLDRSRGAIDRFRIVSHGNSAGLELGGVQGLTSQPTEGLDMKDWFTRKGTEFSDEARFRKHYTDAKTAGFVSESFFTRIVSDLRKDATMMPILTRLGANKDTPAIDSPSGIVMRALVDKFYLGKVKLDTGGAPVFTNRAVLDQFVNIRISTFKPVAVHAVAPAQQPDLETAFADFAVALPAAFDAVGLNFNNLTADEAKTFADSYRDPSAPAKLHSDVTTSLTEGAEGGGPFLKKLRSVKGKINSATHIEIRGCNVGEDTQTLDSFRNFFGPTGNLPSISAPDLFQYFFQLNYSTYTQNPADVANLESAFNTPDTGVSKAFEDQKRLKAGEMMRVVNEPSLDVLATKYGFTLADLIRWNPQIIDPTKIKSGDEVWRVMRPEAPAGKHKTLKAFCKDYIGDEKALADVTAANTHLTDPNALSEGDLITIPKTWQAAKIAAPKATVADFTAAVRGGEVVTGINASNRPESHLDDPKKATALGAWLEKQQFDPKGRTAAQLSSLYAGANFSAQAAKTHINFLSNSYPNIEDPIFPEDQRYVKHIIKRP